MTGTGCCLDLRVETRRMRTLFLAHAEVVQRLDALSLLAPMREAVTTLAPHLSRAGSAG